MKKLYVGLVSMALALCSNVLAISVDESASYMRNSSLSRTSLIIRHATGSLTVMETPNGMECAGVVVKMDYDLDVLVKGKQVGDMGLCVPTVLFQNLTRAGKMSYGAFDLTTQGTASATDANGTTYENCSVVLADNVNPKYEPTMGSSDKAKVLWINHRGSIEWVKDLKISFKSHPDVPVVGAVQIDVSGVSNNGVSFKVGLDVMMQ